MNVWKAKFILVFLAAALLKPAAAVGQEAESHIGKLTGHSAPGRALYFRYCWGATDFAAMATERTRRI
jgi:hypothetical protein